jgi:GTP cyclohydrolase III
VADCHLVPIDSRVREIFEKENDFVVFLRPDNHIAFISSEISLDSAREYLNRIAER